MRRRRVLASVSGPLALVVALVLVGDIQESDSYDAGDADYVELDVSSPDDWEDAIAHVEGEYSQLDILFNNAGIISYDLITEIDLEIWERDLGVNQTSVMLRTKHSIPLMRESGGGSIIDSSSIWATSVRKALQRTRRRKARFATCRRTPRSLMLTTASA